MAIFAGTIKNPVIMFCKYCGQKIDDDSKFCQHCGKPVNGEAPIVQDDGKIKVELSRERKQRNYSKVAAHEIVANLKMIGLGLIVCAIYLLGFTIYHYKDFKAIKVSTAWEYRCYDKGILDGYHSYDDIYEYETNISSEENCFLKAVEDSINSLYFSRHIDSCNYSHHYLIIDKEEKKCQVYIPNYNYDIKGLTPAEVCEKAKEISQKEGFSDSEIKELEANAKEKAKENNDNFCKRVSERRKDFFKKDLLKQFKWSIWMIPCIYILGRYLIMFARWVARNNKKENEEPQYSLQISPFFSVNIVTKR